jgi:hypothetical protein
MELLLCLSQKSLASQTIMTHLVDLSSQLSRVLSISDIQLSPLYADSITVLAYLILLVSKTNAARAKLVAAFLCTMAVAYGPAYDSLSQVGYYCVLAMIYITAAKNISNKKIKHTVILLALFQLSMAMDSQINPLIETWIYIKYEEITALLHLLVIGSSLKLKPIDWHGIARRFISQLHLASNTIGRITII